MESARLKDLAHSLQYVRRDLISVIAPELQSATAQSTLEMICKLLVMLSQEALGSPNPEVIQRAALAAQSLVRDNGEADDGLAKRLAADALQVGEEAEPVIELLEQAAMRIRGDRAHDFWPALDALASWKAARDSGSANGDWETSFQESSGGRGQASTRGIAELLTPETLTSYIRAHVAGCANADVQRLERLPGGYSKGTYIVAVRLATGAEEGWVLRCDLPFTPLDTCVRDEYALLASLFKQGFPVPEPLWFEFEGRLGAPLIAVRKVNGVGDLSQWSSGSAQSRELAHEAARLLAAIHRVDVVGLPPLQTAAPGSQGATPAQVVEHVYAFWKMHRIEADPMVELVFNWLRHNTPKSAARGLVHGDYGLHNLLVDGNKISAVLDWEFAHLGDPREDLAYARPFIEKVLPWSEFLREYEQAGGAPSDDAAIRFYSVLGYLRNGLGCKKVLHAVRDNDPTIDAKFVYVGRSYAQSLVRNTAQMAGLSPAGPSTP